MTPTQLAAAAALSLALGLGGCISLFPKTAPAQLYRFGGDVPAAASPAPPRVDVRASPIDFLAGAAGDGIMTVRGNEVAYIKAARWDGAAQALFGAAVQQGFDAAGGPVRLVEPSQAAEAKARLGLEVTHFEVRYGEAAAPEIVVTLKATLSRESDYSQIGEQTFEAAVPATADRVGAIVQAFDAATTKVVEGLTAWVEQTAGS